jgi:pyruvate dehydrogenase E1 component alpha subunit
VRTAVERAAGGQGPTLIEALTYRIEAHTNADDATRYRDSDEVEAWQARDPLTRLETYLRETGQLDDIAIGHVRAEAEQFATSVRERMNTDVSVDPAELFAHVYAEPTAQLREQRADLLEELREGDLR